MVKILICLVVAAAVVVCGLMIVSPKISGNDVGNVTEVGTTFSYTIEGEVAKPGTYVLTDAISMNDLIYAAGGVIHNTDDRTYFDDFKPVAGTTYYVGGKYDNTDICSNKEIEKVNINKSSADELTKINGITSSIASSIVSYRTSAGTFNCLEDLLSVYGIGNATYRKIRNFVYLHE